MLVNRKCRVSGESNIYQEKSAIYPQFKFSVDTIYSVFENQSWSGF